MPSAIDKAVYSVLASDSALLAAMPNGVYFNLAPAWAKAFVIITKEDHQLEDVFNQTGYVNELYLVEPRAQEGSSGNVEAAAARVHALLHDQPLTVPGYSYMTMHEEGGVPPDFVERDSIDDAIRWHSYGAFYRVQLSL